MDFIEQKKEQFQSDIFKEHTAKHISTGPAQVIEWYQPGTSFYSTTYVLFEGSLMITGDMGEAVYRDFNGTSFLELSNMSLESFTKRLVASSNDRWDFDPEIAKSELEEYRHFFPDEVQEEAVNSIREVINEYCTFEGYRFGLSRVLADYDDELEGEDIAILCEIGRRIPSRLIAYWVGLQMAVEQLKEKQSKRMV